MTDSILLTVRDYCVGDSSETAFDNDLIDCINATFMILWQLGVGPSTPFAITGDTETWGSFVSSKINIGGVKEYVKLKVRKMFDTPTSSSVSASMDSVIAELEWRLNVTTWPAEGNLL